MTTGLRILHPRAVLITSYLLPTVSTFVVVVARVSGGDFFDVELIDKWGINHVVRCLEKSPTVDRKWKQTTWFVRAFRLLFLNFDTRNISLRYRHAEQAIGRYIIGKRHVATRHHES